ncbi:MAG: hypothetical protein IJX88_01940 [Clostridia bacterium]|nr:hypothetical protein [Clostridia bacterium]
MQPDKLRIFNANAIKFLAAALMVIDHVGLLFFPDMLLFRKIGRLSMPLFAFAIAEGCKYTKNKPKHFFLLFGLAVICQTVYYFFDSGNLYMCILVTFSLSVLTIYALQAFKQSLFDKDSTLSEKVLTGLLFALVVFCVYALNRLLTIDYGFWGCMTPVFASLFDFHRIPAPAFLKRLDCIPVRAACMILPLIGIALVSNFGNLPYFALCAIPVLCLYNGERES